MKAKMLIVGISLLVIGGLLTGVIQDILGGDTTTWAKLIGGYALLGAGIFLAQRGIKS